MAPKKVAADVKVTEDASAEGTKAEPKVTKLKPMGHPSTLSMVMEALKDSERKGTSVQAIRSRILAAHPTVDPMRLRFLLKSALNKGIEKGVLIRPPNSRATGATGRFKLAKPGLKSKAEGGDKMSENVDPNMQPKEKTKEKAKKMDKKVPEKSKAKESKDEKEVKATNKKEKTPEVKAVSSKLKKDAAEKPDKALVPAKKPKSKTLGAEEGAKPKKEPAKKKVESKAKDSVEKPAAKDGKKGRK